MPMAFIWTDQDSELTNKGENLAVSQSSYS